MKKLQTLAAATVLALAALPASAVVISTAGGSINMPTGLTVNAASVFENIITGVGQTLRGVGEVNTINGSNTNTFCSSTDCELTFRFDNYVVTSFSGTSFTATGGTFNVFLGFGAANDFNPFTSANSAADLAAATNGDLFLTLAGHQIDAAGNTLQGTGLLIPPNVQFFGGGLLDVVGTAGAANFHFDTNGIPSLFGPADLSFDSSGTFSPAQLGPHPSECTPFTAPAGAECLAGTATLAANVIPEPGTLGLLGIALGSLGFGLRRRNRGNNA